MASEVQWRRGTAAENDAFTGAAGEITVDTTNDCLRLHDGSTAGGTIIPNSSAGHTQNTDTGTTSDTFQIDSGNDGPQIKHNSDVLEVRNDADNDYLPVKAASFETDTVVSVVDTEYTIWDIEDSNSDVVAKCTVECSNITDGSQESEIHFYRMIAGTLTKVHTINNTP